jgi:hypothetical protein
MVEKKGGQIIKQDLLSMKNNDGEIPVLLAAAKGHKEMTSYCWFYQDFVFIIIINRNS